MTDAFQSIGGKALVAGPGLADPNFFRSVVYIIHHDQQGSLGVVINRPTPRSIGETLSEVAVGCEQNANPIYWGGPVDGPLTILYEDPSVEGSIGVDSNPEKIMSFCSTPTPPAESDAAETALGTEDVTHNANQPNLPYLLFDGYAGWGAGQLDAELHQGGWLIWDITAEDVFGQDEELWENSVKRIGRGILSAGIDSRKLPEDPANN